MNTVLSILAFSVLGKGSWRAGAKCPFAAMFSRIHLEFCFVWAENHNSHNLSGLRVGGLLHLHTRTTSLTDFLSPLISSIVISSVCICMCTNVCTHAHACTTVCVWVREDTWLEAVLSFQHVGPKNGIQVLRLGGKYVNLSNHLAGLLSQFL